MSTEEMWRVILERRIELVEARVAALEGGQVRKGRRERETTQDEVADDAELDSQYGDPMVRKDPPRWRGPSHVGLPLSKCEPEYLDELASFFVWQAKKDAETDRRSASGRPTAPYKIKDAARARGWAKRKREWRAANPTPPKPANDQAPDLPDFDIDDVEPGF